MSDVVIRAEGLGKKYLIGHQAQSESYSALRDVIARAAKGVARSARDMLKGRQLIAGDEIEEFWALKDVNFEIKRGDVVGVIGRNGAGKSTLLKILSRITEPSTGRVEIKGRVASLLEVGTGFHPELSGRENIYLNGAILGMSRGEIKRKFDEIVAFAEVEKFLDTPVKHYSSGMYVRLAFSVAAHLEPEILVVDEVLAVGDAEFQKKCLGKMEEVAGNGRTVLFVSHNMGAIQQLCNRGLLLSCGELKLNTNTDDAIAEYASSVEERYQIAFENRSSMPHITAIRIDRRAIYDRSICLAIEFESENIEFTPYCGVVIRSPSGIPVWGSNPRFHNKTFRTTQTRRGTVYCVANNLPLVSESYTVSVWLGDWNEDYDVKLDALMITFGNRQTHPKRPPVSSQGYLEWEAEWSIDPS
jgi:lipopolysaccharide transport system ATP-binding protein